MITIEGKGNSKPNKTNDLIATGIRDLKVDGDVRDMLSVKTKKGNALIVVARNNDRVMVLKNNQDN